jgi:hypothetical protein
VATRTGRTGENAEADVIDNAKRSEWRRLVDEAGRIMPGGLYEAVPALLDENFHLHMQNAVLEQEKQQAEQAWKLVKDENERLHTVLRGEDSRVNAIVASDVDGTFRLPPAPISPRRVEVILRAAGRAAGVVESVCTCQAGDTQNADGHTVGCPEET